MERVTVSVVRSCLGCIVALALGWGITADGVRAQQSVAERRPSGSLDIYWIDVEGGASTLIVTPEGRSILVDAGYAGFNDRDVSRIEHVVRKEAGLTRLDYVFISHYHADHFGGLPELVKRIDIGAFIDHGELVEKTPAMQASWDAYVALAGSTRHAAAPGERISVGGADLLFVASHSQFLKTPLSTDSANPWCSTFTPQAEDTGENGKSLAFLLRVGTFEFANLGDLSWNYQYQLACPANILGKIDLFQVTHHGVRDDVLPQQMWPMAPTVAVMNNGPTKGAGPVGVEHVLKSPGLEDLWSLHRAVGNDAAHNAPERLTANLGETEGCEGAWIRARLSDNGTYTLFNSRNGYSKTYRVK